MLCIVDSLDGNLSASINTGDVELFISRSDGVNIQIQSGELDIFNSLSVTQAILTEVVIISVRILEFITKADQLKYSDVCKGYGDDYDDACE